MVIYYVSQGELVIYLVKSIKEKVRNKLGTLGDAIKVREWRMCEREEV